MRFAASLLEVSPDTVHAVTLRRVLSAIAVVVGAASIVVAVKPFNTTGGLVPTGTTSGLPNGTAPPIQHFLLSTESCRAPIIEAWHGERDRFGLVLGTKFSDLPKEGTVATCRGEARHRVLLAGVGLLGAVVLGGVVLGRRPRSGGEPV